MSKVPSTLYIIPVLSTADLARDIQWYEKYTGFKFSFGDEGYAGIQRDKLEIHLQFHHNNEDDPVIPAMIKIFVTDIWPYFEEFVERGTINKDKLRLNTPWGTHEFGFYDLNNNAIFIVQDA